MEAEHAESRLQGAEETMQDSLDVRALNAKITELESNERKLKAEVRKVCRPKLVGRLCKIIMLPMIYQLVGLIEASRTASILREKLHQSNLKLKASEEKNTQLQKRVVRMVLPESHVHNLTGRCTLTGNCASH